MTARRFSLLRLRQGRAAVCLQSAERARSARARVRTLLDARVRLWLERSYALHRRERPIRPSPVGEQLWRERSDHPATRNPGGFWSTSEDFAAASAAAPAACASEANLSGDTRPRNDRAKSRALAEALAPTMGAPPPGCPDPLDVDWGTWGRELELEFPRTPSSPFDIGGQLGQPGPPVGLKGGKRS